MFDQIVSSPRYAKNEKSKNPWAAKQVTSTTQNLKNRNSVAHNIITHSSNNICPRFEQSERVSIHTVGRFRGISEFNDLSSFFIKSCNEPISEYWVVSKKITFFEKQNLKS